MHTIASPYSPAALLDSRTASVEAYYRKDWLGYDMAPHAHNRAEIMYVISGRCVIRLPGRETALRKGEFILLDAMAPHGLLVAADAPCRMMNIEFSMERKAAVLPLGQLCRRHPALKRLLAEPRHSVVLRDTEDVYGALRRLINSLDESGEGQPLELELHTAELLLAIARTYDDGAVRQGGERYVRRATQFITQNYFREITMEDISTHAGVAAGYLSRLYKKSTGETVMNRLTKLRIRKAKMLLGKTDLPVVEVAGSVGIPSREYFSQLFKKHTGMTLGEYRKACDREPGPAGRGQQT